MKAINTIATLAAAFLLFAATPVANAQRGAMQRSQQGPSGSGHDTRGSHNSGGNSAPQASQGRQGGGQSAAPRNNGGGNRNQGGPMFGGSHDVNRGGGNGPRQAAGPRNNGPRNFGGPAAGPRNNGPRQAAGPRNDGPRHFSGPAAGPRRGPVASPRPAAGGPRRFAGPAAGPRGGFAPRPMHGGPHPIYHHAIDRRARVFYIDEVPYYSWGGVYYRYVPSYGYEEIAMPEDVVVTELPYGAAQVYVNSIGYYEADGMWFQPIDGGYLMVPRPVAHVTVAVPRPHFSFHASFGF